MNQYFKANEAENYVFYKVPKALFTDEKYKAVSTDAKMLYTVDKKRFRDRKGKVNSAFMQKVMTRIASQIGITLDGSSIIEDSKFIL